MNFREKIDKIAEKIKKDKAKITDETNARVIFVELFLEALGFDTKDIEIVEREFGADYKGKGTQKKADYAIKKDGKTIIIIEAKKPNIVLNKVELAQLKGYFSALNEAGGDKTKIAVLTNCTQYKFFTDLKASNQMDSEPFFIFDFEKFSESDLKIFGNF